MKTECPNCGAIWGFEEIDWQECDCCGWPDCDDDDWDLDDDDFDDDDYEENESEYGVSIDLELFREFIEVVQTDAAFNIMPNSEIGVQGSDTTTAASSNTAK